MNLTKTIKVLIGETKHTKIIVKANFMTFSLIKYGKIILKSNKVCLSLFTTKMASFTQEVTLSF